MSIGGKHSCDELYHKRLSGSKIGFFDKDGNQITDFLYDETDGFWDGLAKVKRDGYYGYIDVRGYEVVPCQYDDIFSFCDGLAMVRIGVKYGYVNPQGERVVQCIYESADNYLYGFARVKKMGKWGHLDTSGEETTPCKYDDVEDFSDGLSRVTLNGKIGFVNTSGQEVIPLKYDWAELFSEGLSFVRVGSKYGYINTNGIVVIPFLYEDAEDFINNFAIVKMNGKYGVIDSHGNEIVPFQYTKAEIQKVISMLRSNKTVYSISSQIEQIKQKEPYQVNLLEEVHLHDSNEEIVSRVKENAHSRIIRALLSYNSNGDYVILKSMLNFIISRNKSSEWDSISVSSPNTPKNEIGRIDVLIEEPKKYALIFENKINNAVDQDKQIARYINFVKKMGFHEEQIFILYLSNQGENPSSQTWVDSTSNESYFNTFKNRFINFSFKNWVLPWLKESVFPLVEKIADEKLLQSAVIQYINYLETKYKMKDIDLKIKHIIENQLGFKKDTSTKDKLGIVLKEMDATNSVLGYLDCLKTEMLIEEYRNKYSNLTLIEEKDYKQICAQNIDIAFAFKYHNKQYAAVVYRYQKGQSLNCGVFVFGNNDDLSDLNQIFNWLNTGQDNKRLYTSIRDYNDELIDKLFETANRLSSE